MAYQIPQKLQYSEKIMFGLDFKQLIYAFIFFPIAILSFKKINHFSIAFIIALISSMTGACFMFFNLDILIKNYYRFFKLRKLEIPGKIKEYFGIKEIKNDFIITNKKIAILKIQPINFSIKPKKEREVIMSSFQKFLNSLDFPIQILINTETIELDDYLNSLKSRINEKIFSNIFKEYKKHLNEIITTNKIMNRAFYIIIPEHTNIDIQLNICIERFDNLNLKTRRLKDLEIKELLIRLFGNKNIYPKQILNTTQHIISEKKYYRQLYASGYPRNVEPGFLDRIISMSGNFDLSIHINPYPIDKMMIDLNRDLQKQRADLYSLKEKEIFNPTLEIQYSDTKAILENLQKGQEKLFNISFYITCKADNINELNLLTKKIESELNGLMIIPKNANLRMLQGYKSCLPLAIDELKEHRNITTEALSAFFPFTSQFLEVDDTGIWLGLNKNNIPIIKDIFKLPNPNGMVLSQSGGGKSYFCKLMITRYLLNGTKVMVIDPQGEYRSIVEHFKGQRIDLSKNSTTTINPLDLMGHDYSEKRLSLMDLMPIMLGELSEPQKAFIDKALTEAYNEKGINEDSRTWNNQPPILEDVLNVLIRMEKRAITLEKSTLRSLMNRLSMYVDGVFSFVNKHTNIEFNNRFVCFDIGNMPKQVKPLFMFLVLDYVYMKMKSDIERKILLIDEAWSLLGRTEDASYIFEIVKTCRKFNLGLLLINQEVEGLLNSEAGKSVLANSAYCLLMRQKPAVIEGICNTFHLSSNERIHLLTANVGEGLLIMEDEHSEIKVVASPEEHKLITTNADEILEQSETKEKPIPLKKVNIDVDYEKSFFKHKDLNLDEIKYLIQKKYIISNQKSINGKKLEKFLLKPRFNESESHFFLTYDIANYLKNRVDKINLFETTKPDIVFSIGRKKYAIEIETGKILKNNKKQLLNKVKLLNKNYDNWFFVLTNKKLIPKYRKYGKVIDRRSLKLFLDKLTKNRNLKKQ